MAQDERWANIRVEDDGKVHVMLCDDSVRFSEDGRVVSEDDKEIVIHWNDLNIDIAIPKDENYCSYREVNGTVTARD